MKQSESRQHAANGSLKSSTTTSVSGWSGLDLRCGDSLVLKIGQITTPKRFTGARVKPFKLPTQNCLSSSTSYRRSMPRWLSATTRCELESTWQLNLVNKSYLRRGWRLRSSHAEGLYRNSTRSQTTTPRRFVSWATFPDSTWNTTTSFNSRGDGKRSTLLEGRRNSLTKSWTRSKNKTIAFMTRPSNVRKQQLLAPTLLTSTQFRRLSSTSLTRHSSSSLRSRSTSPCQYRFCFVAQQQLSSWRSGLDCLCLSQWRGQSVQDAEKAEASDTSSEDGTLQGGAVNTIAMRPQWWVTFDAPNLSSISAIQSFTRVVPKVYMKLQKVEVGSFFQTMNPRR